MSEDMALEGLWWMPDEPQRKICGTLQYVSGETIELALNSGWEICDQKEKKSSFPMIFGKLKGDTEITLLDCTPITTGEGNPIDRFLVSSVLQGTQLQKGEFDHSEKDYTHFLQFSSLIKRF